MATPGHEHTTHDLPPTHAICCTCTALAGPGCGCEPIGIDLRPAGGLRGVPGTAVARSLCCGGFCTCCGPACSPS